MAERLERGAAVGGCLFFGAILALTACCGYYQIFSRFQPYDDEGCVLLNTRQFAEGQPLYDGVHALYGPWFYLTNTALHHLGLFPFSHDGCRLLTLAQWMISTLLAGVMVQRFTTNWLLAALGAVLTFLQLGTFANEPGHPLGWLTVLLLAVPVVLLVGSDLAADAHPAAVGIGSMRMAVVGALLAFLVLTKVNVGVFAGAAVAHALVSGLPGRAAGAGRWVLTLLLLLLPAALMRRDLHQTWAAVYLATVVAATIPVLAWPVASPLTAWRDVLAAAVGFLASALAVALAILACGTSGAGLLHGVLLQHLGMPFTLPLPAEWYQALYALTGALGGLAYCRWRDRRPALTAALVQLGKVAFFLVVLANVFAARSAAVLHWALPFVWLGLADVESTPRRTMARRLLVTMAVLQALVAYPAAGSQKTNAVFLLAPIALICLGDVLRESAAVGLVLQSGRLRWLVGGILAALLLLVQGKTTLDCRANYERLLPLGLPGAERIRLPEEYVLVYRWLAANVQTYSDCFYSQPGMNSLYFWTEQQPPTADNTTHWMVSFSPERQRAIVDQLRAAKHPCAVVSEPWTEFWLNGHPLPEGPLVRYLRDEFQTCGRVEGFEFRVLKERVPPALIGCVRVITRPPPGSNAPWTAEATLPPLPRPVGRLAVYELPAGALVAATDARDGKRLESETAGAVRQLRFTPDRSIGPKAVLGLRVYDEAGEWLTTLPFLN